MADSILSDVVGWVTGSSVFSAVNDYTATPIWTKIGILRVEIPSEAESTNQPLSNIQYKDDGTYINLLTTDIEAIKIIKPARMRITAICGDLSTLESVINTQKDILSTLTITTKSVISQNMVVTNVELEQTPEKLSATTISIELEQGVAPAASGYNPAQFGDSNALGFSVQQLNPSTQTVAGLFSKVASKVTNVVKPIAGALLGNQGEPFVLDSSKLG